MSIPVQANRVITDFDTIRKTRVLNDRDNRETRIAMELENRKLFDYVIREDRSIIEFIESITPFSTSGWRFLRHTGSHRGRVPQSHAP